MCSVIGYIHPIGGADLSSSKREGFNPFVIIVGIPTHSTASNIALDQPPQITISIQWLK